MVRAQLVEEVYRARYPDFLRVCMAITGDKESAHDAVQEGFARGLRSLPAALAPDAAEAWLWRVVTNAARDQRRRTNVRAARTATGGNAALEPAVADSIAAPLLELSERQRLVVFLRYYADLSYDQIAAALGVRPGTVAATLNAAHKTLRAALSKEAT